MTKRVSKGLIISGMVVIVLVIGLFVAYAAFSSTPKLAKKISAIEELLPQGVSYYVVFNSPQALMKLYNHSDLHKKAVELGIEKDFWTLPEVERFQKQTHGHFFDVLGRKVLIADYPGGWILISQPNWKVKMVWRWALKSGTVKTYQGVPYCLLKGGQTFCFIGKYFLFSSTEKLLQPMIAQNHQGSGVPEPVQATRQKSSLVYGRAYKGDRFFTYDRLDFSFERSRTGGKCKLSYNNLSGSIGSAVASCAPPKDYSFVPVDAVGFINLTRLDPAQVWQAARQYARSQNRPAFELEPAVARFFTKFDNEGFLLFSGFDTKKSFAPANFLLGLQLKGPALPEEWPAIAPWLLGITPTQTVTYEGLSVDLFELGENLPTFASTVCQGYFLLANSTDLLKAAIDTKTGKRSPVKDDKDFNHAIQVLNISQPGLYLNVSRLLTALKPYLSWAGDKSLYFSAPDVEKRITPLLDGIKTKALLGQLTAQGKNLEIEIYPVSK
jgi:hypothetical protein